MKDTTIVHVVRTYEHDPKNPQYSKPVDHKFADKDEADRFHASVRAKVHNERFTIEQMVAVPA